MLEADLRYLIQISTCHSLASAAEELGVSQSTLSRAVQRLELRFSTALLERTARGVQLTDAGSRLVARLRLADRHLQEAQAEMSDLAKARKGLVRVAVGHTVSSPVTRALVPRLQMERPATRLQLDAWFNDQIFSRLQNGEYDFAVCVIPRDLSQELVARPLLQDRLLPVVRQGHPLTLKPKLAVKDLVLYPWVGANRHVLSGAALDELFIQSGFSGPLRALESNSFEVTIDALKSSDCVAFAPDWMVDQQIGIGQGLTSIFIRDFSHPREIGIIQRSGTYLSPLASRAQELVTTALEVLNTKRSASAP